MISEDRMGKKLTIPPADYDAFAGGIRALLESARHASARAVNTVMTAAYWEIGRRIVEFEQGGSAKAGYGEQLIKQLAKDLTARFGRGFGPVNLSHMKRFYLTRPKPEIFQTTSEKSNAPVTSSPNYTPEFPLPWSHYVRLLSVKKPAARQMKNEPNLCMRRKKPATISA